MKSEKRSIEEKEGHILLSVMTKDSRKDYNGREREYGFKIS